VNIDIFSIQDSLRSALGEAARGLCAEETAVTLERPKDKSHGDFATPLAMTLAKKLKKPPLEIARLILENLKTEKGLVQEAQVAPPGFINIRLHPSARYSALQLALEQDQDFGKNRQFSGLKVLLEFVSANPTGPLNVVNARAAALGDSIANLLSASGAEVEREYYINDAGRQARLFGESLEAAISRMRGFHKDAPEGGYQGAYMDDLAKAYLAEKDDLPQPDFNDSCEKLGEWGMHWLIQQQKEVLERYGVHFDIWFSEQKKLHDSGLVQETFEKLKSMGLTYEKDGATWIRTSEYGAHKDEVLIKSNGQPAYIVADIAYHLHKLNRGHQKVVNIMGPDHHGHILSMTAAHKALGFAPENFEVIIAQQVNLLEGGEKVKMSKREGKFISMEELLEEVGKDAARFFFVMRGANSHLDFDIEVAKKRTEENPVFYIQYAHARICSLLKKTAERGYHPALKASEMQSLKEEEALLLLKEILEYPQWVAESGRSYEPHRMVVYLQTLAADFHYFYSKCRILDSPPEVAGARLALALAVKNVLRNALGLIGVSAPEQM
jgi:arginyl-tRNA synthetase